MFPTEPVPERIGAYKVIRRLAGTGSADLYLGRLEGPMGFQRVCALKLVDNSIEGDVRFAEELAREASICANLNHPAIVRMFDFFEYDRRLVLVLEHVDGVDLDRVTQHLARRRQKLTDDAIWYIAHQLCSALAHAHAATDENGNATPVIHRNLQPENVLISWDGQVRLTGFGLGKILGRTPDTVMGVIKGTPGYMAPEQARGERVTTRVDVYLIGLLLWSLLSEQRPPIDGRRPESITQFRKDIPREIAAAIDAALEPSPDRRKISCQDLEQWLGKVAKIDAGRSELRDKVMLLRSLRLPVPDAKSTRPAALPPRRRVGLRNVRPSQRPAGPGPISAPPKSSRPPLRAGSGGPPNDAGSHLDLATEALRHKWRSPVGDLATIDALLETTGGGGARLGPAESRQKTMVGLAAPPLPTASARAVAAAPADIAAMGVGEARPRPDEMPTHRAPPLAIPAAAIAGSEGALANAADVTLDPDADDAPDARWRDVGSDAAVPTRGFATAVPLETPPKEERPLSALASLGIATGTAAVVVTVGVVIAARDLTPGDFVASPRPPPSIAATAAAARTAAAPPAEAPTRTPQDALEHAVAASRSPAALPNGAGALTVMFTGSADVYLNGRPVGPTNDSLQVRCGRWFVRLGNPTDTGIPEWVTKGETVIVPCQGSVAITMVASTKRSGSD